MRNKRFFIVLVGALIFGVLAAVSVSKYLSTAQGYTKNLKKVVVAKVSIPIGSKIIAEQLMVVQFPTESTLRSARSKAWLLAAFKGERSRLR